ncbi:YecA family protein [Agrilutibacter solisilvae]|uniref:SEC-C domain-containing protein n=1 Tax=Agrilutibacter solisilvae TaxID=2763317 RepID=A0A974Y1B4_9GAMM|nr:SEC-C domain-containing protein [Lysobacter solisilvae]QSX78723.1 SEC-C domain-containing protein [Lysobacter solisilvae]
MIESQPRNAPCSCGSGRRYKHCHGAIVNEGSGFPGDVREGMPKNAGRLPRLMVSVEAELSRAIKRISGVRIDSILGKTAEKNADFLFDRHSVIAELKELEVDQIASDRFMEKCTAIYERYRSEGKLSHQAFGTVRLSTEGLPEEFTREIADLYAVPISRVIRSADEQIKSTRRLLDRSGHLGLLILVNNGNTALDPKHVIWSLGRHLGGAEFPNINSVVFFTVNMPVESDEVELLGEMDLHVWYSAGRREFDRVEEHFLELLRKSWFSHLASLGAPVAELPGAMDQLRSLRNSRKPSE